MQLPLLNSILTVIFCLIIPVAGLLVFAVISTRTRFETVAKINRLRSAGVYQQWESKNKQVIQLEQIGWIGFLVSGLSIIILPSIAPDLARFAFVAFVAFALLSVGAAFLFHNRIMQAAVPPPVPKPPQASKAVTSKFKIGSLLFVFVILLVYVIDKLAPHKGK